MLYGQAGTATVGRTIATAGTQVAVLQRCPEHLLHHVLADFGGIAGGQTVTQAEVAQILGDHAASNGWLVLLGSETFSILRLDENRCRQQIGARTP